VENPYSVPELVLFLLFVEIKSMMGFRCVGGEKTLKERSFHVEMDHIVSFLKIFPCDMIADYENCEEERRNLFP
jgi:hypothetical protein